MDIAGISVRDDYLPELATMLRRLYTAERIADAPLDDKPRINLTVDDREAVTSVLFHPLTAIWLNCVGFFSKTGRLGTRSGCSRRVTADPQAP